MYVIKHVFYSQKYYKKFKIMIKNYIFKKKLNKDFGNGWQIINHRYKIQI
jgi:hypothetical protein